MAWPDVTIKMLRILIGDADASEYEFNDDRLMDTLVVSAQFVNQEIDFSTTYTISVPLVTISPDPTAVPDDAFTNFIVLKAACFMDLSTFRTKAALSGLKAKCGPIVLETVEHMRGFKELLTLGPCAAYDTLKKDWIFGESYTIKAIMSPFVSNNFDPSNLPHYNSDPRSGYY